MEKYLVDYKAIATNCWNLHLSGILTVLSWIFEGGFRRIEDIVQSVFYMKDASKYIDIVLTARNCSRKGYYWVQDILYYEHAEYGTIEIFKESFEKGYKLGKPRDKTLFSAEEGRHVYGFYAPKQIVAERLSNVFNPLLSPQDAKENGYVYVDDIIYNVLEPNTDVIDLIQEHGYKLGLAQQGSELESYFGLYMPSHLAKKEG